MKLYSLYYGRSKKKVNQRLMTDSLKKCENYKRKRESTKGSECYHGFHEIREATEEEIDKGVWKKQGSNRENGWIGKHGWQPHT